VNSWPINYEESWTLRDSIAKKGIGLHSGMISEIVLSPSDKYGFYISWRSSNEPPIRLELDQVRESKLCTSLQIDNHRLSTVEHLFAALAGCGITHVNIQVSGEEVPLLDGSAIEWVKAIQEVGLVKLAESRPLNFCLDHSLVINRGESIISAVPSDTFKLVGIINFPYKAIGKQVLEIDLTPDLFVKEIAPARTFGFKDQIESLMKSGLIKGGGLDNALVCEGDHWLNPPLRFPDEPIRHKILDLIGDLSLVGFPKAQVLVYKGSHGLHTDFALELMKSLHKDNKTLD